jgi:hypothetical protein
MQGRVREVLAGLIVVAAVLILSGIAAPPAAAQAPIAPAPKQPILFSHKIHAGDFKIDCQYCHADARRSTFAGVPSVKRCMGCHQIVASKDAELQKEVEKLRTFAKESRPVEWVRSTSSPGSCTFHTSVTCRQGWRASNAMEKCRR